MSAHTGGRDVLVTVPKAQLHKVEGGVATLLASGDLSLYLAGAADSVRLLAQVGDAEWGLHAALLVLKAAPRTYVFAIPDPQVFYTVSFGTGVDTEEASALEAFLEDCTCFQVSGALSADVSQRLVDEVTNAVLEEAERVAALMPGSGSPAASASPGLSPPPSPRASRSPSPSAPITPGTAMASSADTTPACSKEQAACAWVVERIVCGNHTAQATPRDEPLAVSPETKARIRGARMVAGRTAALASSMASGAAYDLPTRVAEGIVKRMAATEYGKHLTSPHGQAAAAAREVAAAAAVAAAQIYESMECAARLVVRRCAREGTTSCGDQLDEPGCRATDAGAPGEPGAMQYNAQKMGIRRVARRIAKRTASGMLHSMMLAPEGARSGTPNFASAASMPLTFGRARPSMEQARRSGEQRRSIDQPRRSFEMRRPPARIAQQS